MKNEKMLHAIGQIDDDMIEDAAIQPNKKKRPFYRMPAFRRAVAIAACFAVVVGILLFMLPQIKNGSLPGETQGSVGGMLDNPEQGIVFDSLDKVNYYAGLKLVRQQSAGAVAQNIQSKTGYSVKLLNNTSEPQGSYPAPGGDDEEFKGGIGSEDISSECLRITTAIYFQLEVTEQDEFLASKVGTGTVNAVITDLHIGVSPFAMITFKNGDRYFSCLTENRGLREEEYHFFGTHLYISGFELYKDTTNGVSHFRVYFDWGTEQVTSVSWIPYDRNPSEAPVYPIAIVPDSTHRTQEIYEFTLQELADYYNGIAEPPQPIEPVRPENVYICTEAETIEPLACPVWEEYYDSETQSWHIANYSDDAYTKLQEGIVEIPAIRMGQELFIKTKDNGAIEEEIKVYCENDDGGFDLYLAFNGTVEELVGLLPPGDWYVVFSAQWQDDYVPEEDAFERHYSEYLFKIIVEGEVQ